MENRFFLKKIMDFSMSRMAMPVSSEISIRSGNAPGTEYPGVPYFMLGHSMGSFLLRQYILSHGRGLSGAVIMGTGDKSYLLLSAGQLLCRAFALVKGWHYRSRMIDRMGLGSYNRKFEPVRAKKSG